MSDRSTRLLERSGDPLDRARWLRQRVREGALTPERVELAARCGHPAALELYPQARAAARRAGQQCPECLEGPGHAEWCRSADLQEFLLGFLDASRPARVHAALAVGEAVCEARPGLRCGVSRFRGECGCGSGWHLLEAARAWVERPSEPHLRACARARRRARERASAFRPELPALSAAAELALSGQGLPRRTDAALLQECAVNALALVGGGAPFSGVRPQLIEWALGRAA